MAFPHRNYRLTLDIPYSFPKEKGVRKVVNCTDFRHEKESFKDCFQCPVTGLLMLAPSFLNRDFTAGFRPLVQWRYKNGFWQESLRAAPSSEDASGPAHLLNAIWPAGQPRNAAELVLNTGIISIQASATKYDRLYWCLESQFTHPSDQPFVLNYHAFSDPMARKHNFFGFQIDDMFLHFSQYGTVRVYQYDRANMTTAPKFVEEFDIAAPVEMLQRDAYFALVPIPHVGVCVYFNNTPPKIGDFVSNAFSGVTRGHLIKWPTRTVGGEGRIFDDSLVRLAFNPWFGILFGFQEITFPVAGSFVDSTMDPGYKPTVAPTYEQAITVNNGKGIVYARLRNQANTADWSPGTDRQGRMKLDLTTGDTRYSPFVFGYGLEIPPVLETRNTTPVEVHDGLGTGGDRIWALEVTHDEWGRVEGHATLMIETAAARKIAERGDAPFRLEYSENAHDPEPEWHIIMEGLTREWDVDEAFTWVGVHYECNVALRDWWDRFTEGNQVEDNAFDGVSLGDAFNAVMRMTGFPQIDPVPAEVQAIKIPDLPGDKHWRHASGAGDDGTEVLRTFLQLLQRQHVEWRMPYDYTLTPRRFKLEKKPRDESSGATWTVTAFSDEADPTNRVLPYRSARFRPLPPEGNEFVAVGFTGTDNSGQQILSPPMRNRASISSPGSKDYLGRVVRVRKEFHSLSDQGQVNLAARRMHAALSSHQSGEQVQVVDWRPDMPVPARLIRHTLDADRNRVSRDPVWVKRKTLIIGQDGIEYMNLDLSDQWEGENV